jgi:hypothetical protein
VFLDHAFPVLVLTQSHELRVPEMLDLRFILNLLIERATLWTNDSIYPLME